MSAKVIYTLREDKQEIQKQLGCMNGIFQLFDRRYLHGQRRHGHNQKQLPQAQSDNNKELNNASEKSKDKITKEKHRVSVESSRNSYSSSCSSLDCSKRVRTEPSSFCPSIVSEPSSPTSNKKQDFSIPQSDIKNVVKESMTRKPRVVSVKTVAKDERKGPVMTHTDSPRPLQHPKPVSYERKDQNLAKLQEISNSRGVKDVRETSRFSYDNRESPYKLKSMANMEERPRLSLDSKQSSIKNLANRVDQRQTHEPGSNKRPSSSVVARLMGLEITTEVIVDELVPVSISPRKYVAPKNPNALPRIPLELAPWKQEVSKKQPAHKKVKARERPDHGGQSVYGQIERRLTDVEFKTSGKDLRALKQILEAIQRTQMRLEKTEHQPVSPAIKRPAIKPAINVRKVNKVNHTVERRISRLKTKKPVSPSNEVSCNARNSGNVSPRKQRSKNEMDEQSVHGVKKQSNRKIMAVNRMQTNDQSGRYISHKRNTSQQSETVSFPSESDTSVTSQNEPEVTNKDWTHENKNKFAERLMGYKPMAELGMLTMEQPSPVSVLDTFYTEDTPSPIQKKSFDFKDDEDLRFDEREWNQVGIDNLITSTNLNQQFNQIKFENLVRQIELLNSTSDQPINEDHIYIKEILLASGFMKNLDSATKIAHLHPTGTLINPQLFNLLEKTKEFTSKSEKMKRKMIFDNVNNILMEKVIKSASSGMWATKRKLRIINGEKLLEELWLEINNLENNTSSGLYDEIINIINEDVNKQSEDWNDKESSEVSGLVLDIERLIFKDLISEIVNAEVAGPRDGHGRYRRQLFLM